MLVYECWFWSRKKRKSTENSHASSVDFPQLSQIYTPNEASGIAETVGQLQAVYIYIYIYIITPRVITSQHFRGKGLPLLEPACPQILYYLGLAIMFIDE